MDSDIRVRPTTPGPLDIAAFACEVAMFILLGLAAWRLFDAPTATRIIAMLVLPSAAVGVWAVWMAPTSSRRLANPMRLIAQIALFSATAAIASAAGLAWVAVVWAALAVTTFSALAISADRA